MESGILAGELLSDRYEVREPIGSGAMGAVYRAWDREARREVALKWLLVPDAEDRFRLKHAFRALAGIIHPNLLRLYDLVADGDRCFLTAELIEGGQPLTAWVGALPPGERAAAIRSAFGQLARGLRALHAERKIHRDLKPANILVEPAGRLVLLDFDLVSDLGAEAREEVPGTLIGTLAYASPEQARGASLGPASDWYSVGVLLYECLAGVSPFAEATPLELSDRRWLRIPRLAERAPDAPSDLVELAEALLAHDPARRPPADRVLSVLDPFAASAPGIGATGEMPFVGRADELGRLRFAYATVCTGESYVVHVSGASGIGKTSLVERFLASIEPGEALILRARCHPREAVPFAALDEAIDELALHLLSRPPGHDAALALDDVDALLTVFPVLGRAGLPRPAAEGSHEPHALRRRAFRALRALLALLATERPLVVWGDDLQWADRDSEPLLRALLTPPGIPSVLWILTQRSDEDGAAPVQGLLDELPDLVGAASHDALALAPLDPDESVALVARLASGRPLATERLAALAEEGAGSPFLLAELAHSATTGAAPVARAGYAAVLGARIQALSAPARRLVETLAVASGPLDRHTALEAAGILDFDPDLLDRLQSARLLRIGSGRIGGLELYHARIRETLVAGALAETRRERHAAIASVLVRRGSEDLRALFEHHRGAGLSEPAAGYAFRAAEQAAGLLAFDEAARLFGAALELAPEAIDRARALRGRAEALANAGRGGDAAHAFAQAAQDAARQGGFEESVRLRCSATEQYLVSGHLREGVEALAPLLAELGLPNPRTPRAALAATFASLPTVGWRYLRPAPRSGAPLPVDAALAIDACHTAAKGLVVVDPARAAYFALRSLRDSLATGDAVRRGRAFCVVGSAIVPLGGPLGAWGRRMLEQARQLADETGDPYLEGMVPISRAQVSCVEGAWREMLRLCDQGTRHLRAHCFGVRWECDVGHMAAVRALEELGRIAELEDRLAGLLEEARALDDVYGEVTFLLYAAFWAIARGDTTRARADAQRAVARWSGEGFQLQHLYELRVQAFCDLYEGDAAAAWQRVEAAWPAVRRSNLLSHLLLRGDALEMRGRVALAHAAEPRDRHAALRIAQQSARALARLGRPDALARAALLEAGIAARRGGRKRAEQLAAEAAAGFAAVDMPLHAAQARLCAAALRGAAPEASAPREEARAALAARRIADPPCWMRVAAPGFEEEWASRRA